MDQTQLEEFVYEHLPNAEEILCYTAPKSYYMYLVRKHIIVSGEQNRQLEAACILFFWKDQLINYVNKNNIAWTHNKAFWYFRDEHIYILKWLIENDPQSSNIYREFQKTLLGHMQNIQPRNG